MIVRHNNTTADDIIDLYAECDKTCYTDLLHIALEVLKVMVLICYNAVVRTFLAVCKEFLAPLPFFHIFFCRHALFS